MKIIERRIAKIAPTPSTVLITGESGTGKEVTARQIHDHSQNAEGLFLALNIGGIPETLLESELFGYEKGAFTGATMRKQGLLELASGGTLFLDEIGDMPMPLQVKLLRVLQDHMVRRLGGTRDLPINARIIAATNKDLEILVRKKLFREDLFYRLNVARIHLPPLRERMEDLPSLTGIIMEKLNRKLFKEVKTLSEGAMTMLRHYPFPGNIRELENVMERGFIFCDGPVLDHTHIELPQEPRIVPLSGSLKEMEKNAVIAALQKWEKNQTRAAAELGVSRRTIFNKIKEYGLDEFAEEEK